MAPVVKVGHCCSSSRSQARIRDTVNRDHTGNIHTENQPIGADTHFHQFLSQKLQVVLFHLSTVRKLLHMWRRHSLQRIRMSRIRVRCLTGYQRQSRNQLNVHTCELVSNNSQEKKTLHLKSEFAHPLPASLLTSHWHSDENVFLSLPKRAWTMI